MSNKRSIRAPGARHGLELGHWRSDRAASAARWLEGGRVRPRTRQARCAEIQARSPSISPMRPALSRAVAAERDVTAFVHAAGLSCVCAPLGELDAERRCRHVARARAGGGVARQYASRQAFRRAGASSLIGSRTASGAAGRSQYAATKAALVGMARSWAIELAPRGITVNVVAPAATDTPMLQDRHAGRRASHTADRPVRAARRSGCADRVRLSEEAAAITGQQIVICGGSSL